MRQQLIQWAGRFMFGANLLMFVVLIAIFLGKGASFTGPWSGPDLATVSLTAATLVLAAVALGVGLLAIWGYTTLREHSKNVAEAVASRVAEERATATVQAWIDRLENPSGVQGESGDDIAQAYGRE